MTGTGQLKRQRSLNDSLNAASALVGLAEPPRAAGSRKASLQKLQNVRQTGLANWVPGARRSASDPLTSSTDTVHTALAYVAGTCASDDDLHPVGKGASTEGGSCLTGALAAGLSAGAGERVNPLYLAALPSFSPSPMSDAQLLTSTAVLLASCGLVHALNVSTDKKTVERQMSDSTEKSDHEDAPPPPAPTESSPQLRPTDGDETPGESFSASVWRILRQECAHVRALGRPEFARLCQLLDLPLEMGVHWQTRILRLQSCMREQAEQAPLPPYRPGLSGECASVASSAFEAALGEEKGSSRGAVRRFGRQTVWCTVSLLRRVLRDASWQAGDRSLTSAQAESRLASLAVAAISGADAVQ